MMKARSRLTASVSVTAAVSFVSFQQTRAMVSLHGNQALTTSFRMRHTDRLHAVTARPPDPNSLLSATDQQECIDTLLAWFAGKSQILCLTGAGLSTESGIPDYRGNNGSYHRGHRPMVHDQFMKSECQRKRYWGRGMVGWKSFDETAPNAGHVALAELERLGRIGVAFEDNRAFYEGHDDDLEWTFRSGHRKLSLITQNVDTLHRRAGTKHLIELHGRTDQLECMQCGTKRDRNSFHAELEGLNTDWLNRALATTDNDDMRPDGDAAVGMEDFESVQVPPCQSCGGFMKPSVVFFGDTVPRNRVAQCQTAVEKADGLLVVGSSLAVHSAFRHVRAASKLGVPIAILNVGGTRAEAEGLDVLKIEAPTGQTLEGVAKVFQPSSGGQRHVSTDSL
jgi:NAD-dependent deacetylase sirtuin 4